METGRDSWGVSGAVLAGGQVGQGKIEKGDEGRGGLRRKRGKEPRNNLRDK